MELRDFFHLLRSRAWVIVLVTVIVVATTAITSFSQPKLYQGRAVVLVSEKDASSVLLGTALSDFSNPQRGLDTQVEVMQQPTLAEVAVRKLDLRETPESLLKQVKVAAVGGTNMVEITVTDRSPRRAADIANALAAAYVDWSRNTKRASIKNTADQIEARLTEAQAQILTLGAKMARTQKKDRNGQPIKDDQLSAQLAIASGLYSTLAEKLEQLRINEQLEVGSGQIVTPATVNQNKISPKLANNLALGLIVGVAFGLGVAFLIEYLDNSIKSTSEAEALYGAPVIGDIPADKAVKGDRRLAILESPASSTAEAYRALRNSLDYINFQHDIKTLLVTSAEPSEGKSTVAANLAAGLAQAGKKVVLISCDFRRSTAELFFDVQSQLGLSDVLTQRATIGAALQTTQLDTLLVLTAGKMPPNPSELLGSEEMHEVLRACAEAADWVIVDSPPLLVVADPAAVSRWVDGVLVVTRAGSSSREAAKRSRELLDNVGARVSGVVMSNLRGSGRRGRHGYYYGHYRGYYGADAGTTAGSGLDATPVQGPTRQPAAAGAGIGAVAPHPLLRRIPRILAWTLGFVAVLALVLAIVFVLDKYMGWGLLGALLAIGK